MEKVVILESSGYDSRTLREKVHQAFSHFGGVTRLVRPGDRVLLKPNLLVKASGDSGVVTHPRFVQAVAQVVGEAGAYPSVGDSPAFGTPHQVARACGLAELLEKDGIPLVPFRSNTVISQGVRATASIKDFDKIVNLPKFKAHSQMLCTGAVKNLYGLVSGKAKAWRHFTAHGNREEFSLMLLDLLEQIRPSFTLVDAIDIMEKTGPRGGNVRTAGLIFAGINCISLDRVICEVFGIAPERHPILSAASAHGFAGHDLSRIEVCGRSVWEARRYGYAFPELLDDISFSFPRVIRSVARHIRERCRGNLPWTRQ